MSAEETDNLTRSLAIAFMFFAFSSTFSIALAQISLGISLVLFLIIAIRDRYNPFGGTMKPIYLLIAAYILWLWIAASFNDNPLNSVNSTREEWLFGAIPVGIYLFQNTKTRNQFMIALAAAVLMISIYGIYQHFTGDILFKDRIAIKAPDFGYTVSGQFSHRLTFGNYFGLVSAFLFTVAAGKPRLRSDRPRLFILFASLLGIIVTLLSYSRGPIFSLALILLISGFVAGKRLFRIGVPALVLFAIALAILQPNLFGGFKKRFDRDLNSEYAGSRTFIWKKSAEIVRDNPVFGVGSGNFKKEYSKRIPTGSDPSRQHSHAHNDLLNFAAIAGIPGALLWLALFATICFKLFKIGRSDNVDPPLRIWANAALVASLFFLAASMTEAVFADEEVRQALMFIWAAGLTGINGLTSYSSIGTEPPRHSKKA